MEPNNKENDTEFWKRLIANPRARQEAARNNLMVFYLLYRSRESNLYNLANFQKEIMGILQDPEHTFFVLEAARGSGKTTLAVYMNAIWSIVGARQLKYVVIITRNNEQARMCMNNIKYLMLQEPLRSDMGPFKESEGEWRSTNIDILKYGARITILSIEQQIRGITHNGTRPQLFLIDDLENYASAKSPEMREKIYQTLVSDIMPAGDKDTRYIVIGTRLHEESLIMHLKNQIEDNKRDGIFRSYPIMQGNRILWPEKYSMEDIKKLKRQTDPLAWANEYMLKLIPPEDQIVKPEWIKYYDIAPEIERENFSGFYAFVDPAFSESKTADCTAIVVMAVYWNRSTKTSSAYVVEVINRRMSLPASISECKRINDQLWNMFKRNTTFVIEGGNGLSLGQMLKREKLNVVMINPGQRDKRYRLHLASEDIKNGNILFQKKGCETLIRQIVNFGSEKFDDACDALTLYSLFVLDQQPRPSEPPRILLLDWNTGEIS